MAEGERPVVVDEVPLSAKPRKKKGMIAKLISGSDGAAVRRPRRSHRP
jgi:hypothetical protein